MKEDEIQLEARGDAVVLLRTDDDGGEEEVEVRVLYARPVSAPQSEISVVEKKSKKEVAWFDGIDDVPPALRPVVGGALEARYRVSTVTAVTATRVANGQRLVTVRTDQGERRFNLKEPGKNITQVPPDALLIRDSMGNRYRIKSVAALDPDSRAHLDRVM